MKQINKKGSTKGMVGWAVGILVLIQVLISVFGSDGLANTNWTTNAPAILVTIMPLLILVAVIGFVVRKKN